MIDWIVEKQDMDKEKRIIDLGCGNGHLIFDLYERHYRNIVGVDYSFSSIELCRSIQLQQHIPENEIQWYQLDVLQSVENLCLFDLVLDKGTFDAISLASRHGGTDSTPANRYVESVNKMLSEKGILLITSCNWTEQELIVRFSKYFTFLDRVKYPSFQFGGMSIFNDRHDNVTCLLR